jgi:hypothetical protein
MLNDFLQRPLLEVTGVIVAKLLLKLLLIIDIVTRDNSFKLSNISGDTPQVKHVWIIVIFLLKN